MKVIEDNKPCLGDNAAVELSLTGTGEGTGLTAWTGCCINDTATAPRGIALTGRGSSFLCTIFGG